MKLGKNYAHSWEHGDKVNCSDIERDGKQKRERVYEKEEFGLSMFKVMEGPMEVDVCKNPFETGKTLPRVK